MPPLGHKGVTVAGFEAEHHAAVITLDHRRPGGNHPADRRRRHVIDCEMDAYGRRLFRKGARQCGHGGGLEKRGKSRRGEHGNITAAEGDGRVGFSHEGFHGRREARLDHAASLGIGSDEE